MVVGKGKGEGEGSLKRNSGLKIRLDGLKQFLGEARGKVNCFMKRDSRL